MWAIAKKEFKSMFYSPIGYVVIAMFLVIYSCIFYITAISNGTIDLSSTYYWTAFYGLPFITAGLTMRSFSEERKNGTEQLLEMSPRSIWSIVLGKFIALIGVIAITLIFSLMYYFILRKYGDPDIKLVLITMLGFLLLSMAYISFGNMISSLTENQVIAAIITFAFCMIPAFIPINNDQLSFISLLSLYQKLSTNVITTEGIVGFLSFTLMCLTLTVLIIQKRKCMK